MKSAQQVDAVSPGIGDASSEPTAPAMPRRQGPEGEERQPGRKAAEGALWDVADRWAGQGLHERL